MRLIGAGSLVYLLAVTFAMSGLAQTDANLSSTSQSEHSGDSRHRDRLQRAGKHIFRFDTFGDEQLWTDVLRMHEVIPAVVDPKTALGVGLKVDEKSRAGERLWALGPLTKGRYWEIIAVPDIREQAAIVADDIARELQP